MKFETLLFHVADGVATITLNRPDAANAIDAVCAKEFFEAATLCDDDPQVRAVVLTGAGRMFCAGGDLGAFAGARGEVRSVLKQIAGYLHMGLSRLCRSSAPVVGAINGTAAGAGFSLVMATDLAVAARSAVFTMAYTKAGLSPDGGSTYFMPRKIGDRRTRELMLTNRVLNAEEALSWGIVTEVVDDDQVLVAATTLAQKLAAGPTLAHGTLKTLLNGTFDQSLESQMELEARAISDLAVSEDGQEGIKAFLDKRRPEFKGR